MMNMVINKARLLVQKERLLTVIGLLGFVLAAVSAVWALLGGEATLFKAASFNAALGIFLLSTAAVLPASGFSARGSAVFRYAYAAFTLYAYTAETMQHARGVDPRFAQGGAAFDVVVAGLFSAVAGLLVIFYLVLAASFLRKRVYEKHPELTLSIRYAMAAVLVAFAGGIWISIQGSRMVGAAGNVIWLHGIGFHALQALPVIGWLVGLGALQPRMQRLLIHTAGAAFLLGLGAIGWQTALGQPMLVWSALPAAAAACFGVVAAVGVMALLELRKQAQAPAAAPASALASASAPVPEQPLTK